MSAFLVGALLSAASGIAGNSAIASQASANQRATQLMIDQKRDIAYNELFSKADELNKQIGAELTNIQYGKLATGGKVTAVQTERNIYGMTAARNKNMVDVKAELAKDQVIQKGEAAMKDIQVGLSNVKYDYDSNSIQNMNNYYDAMSKQKSAFEIATGSVSAGLSMASSYKSAGGLEGILGGVS